LSTPGKCARQESAIRLQLDFRWQFAAFRRPPGRAGLTWSLECSQDCL
jgi:hypothetical protein